MVVSSEELRKDQSPVVDEEASNGEDDEDFDEEEEEDDEEEDEVPLTPESRTRLERTKMENLLRRISTERVPILVHDVLIKGNTKTKGSLIEAEVEGLKNVTSLQELIRAASIANARLQRLKIFDSVDITLDSGPPELLGTANVIVEVVETKNPLAGEIGIFSKPEDTHKMHYCSVFQS